jgi:hypothetical protein
MRTNPGTTTGVQFVAVFLVVALLLTAVFVVAPREAVAATPASAAGSQPEKIIFGQVVFPGETSLPPDEIAFCKANGWEIELSVPANDGYDGSTYLTNTALATWYAGVIQNITNQGVPVWLEIEGPVYYSSMVSVATTPAQYQALYGQGLAIYEKLGPLFKGYSFEGGYDNAIIWLKENSDRELLAHWLAGYYEANNSGAPNYTPANVPAWGTHSMTWRVNQFDEIVWEIYQVDWAQSAVQFKNWLDTVAPSKPFGVLTGWEASGGYWWNQYGHNYYPAANYPAATDFTGAQQQALLTKWITWLCGQIGPFAVTDCDPGGSQSVTVPCTYLDSLNLTNGTPTAQIAPASSPAVSAQDANSLGLFVRGSDNALWYKYWNGVTWSVSKSLGGALTSSPAATSPGNGLIDVFVRGTDGAIWQRTSTNGGGSWSGWTSLGGQIPTGTVPSVCSWGAGRLDLFVKGTDGALWYKWYTGTSWSGWQSLGGKLTSSAAAATAPGSSRIDVFVRGSDGAIWQRTTTNSGSSWSGWTSLGGQIPTGTVPSVCSWGAGRLDLFVKGTDGALWYKWYTGTSWSGWQSLGGKLTSSPAAAAPASGIMDIFVLGSDNGLWQKTYNNSAWGSWTSVGGI